MFAKAVFDKNPVKDDTYLMLPPKGMGAGGRILAGGGAAKRWFVIKGAKNREAAEQLIRYMCGGRHPEGDVQDLQRLRLPGLRVGLGRAGDRAERRRPRTSPTSGSST